MQTVEMAYALKPLPPAPKGRCPEIRQPYRFLAGTHASVTGLLDSFEVVRDKAVAARGTAAGRLSRDQVDLLRAALVFTSSGLDATCQALVRECAPTLIAAGGTAERKFELYLEEELRAPSPEIVMAIKARAPRKRLVALYVERKTKASYQGSSDLKERVRDLLGITNAQLPSSKITALDSFFKARNDIVHRLDYEDPASRSNKRHHRAPASVLNECDSAVALMAHLIQATADKLK